MNAYLEGKPSNEEEKKELESVQVDPTKDVDALDQIQPAQRLQAQEVMKSFMDGLLKKAKESNNGVVTADMEK